MISERDIFLQGDHILLKALTEQDVLGSPWYGWFNDALLMANMQKHYYPNTVQEQMEFYRKEVVGNSSKLQLGIVHKNDQMLIGVISLGDINHIHRRCEIAGFIGERKYQKLVYFIEANHLMLKHAFRELNLHRVYGGTLIPELVEIYVRLLGFRREGIKRHDIYKNNQYRDVHLIGLIKDDYEQLFP